jgi:molecular chaperone DnaK
MPNTVWGIDLGTTYSCIARVNSFGQPEVITNREGDPTTPSVVLMTDPINYQVGKEAKRQMQMDPDNVCDLVKRQMGNPEWRFRAFGQEFNAAQVSSMILKSLAADAALNTGEEVIDVVITVPAYFGDVQRQTTRAAGEIAGLNVVDIVNEPTAAALSYGFAQGGEVTETVLVFDLGGGTFDVTVIRLEGGDIRVVVTDGDHMLGGANWDDALMKELARKFMEADPAATDPLDDDIGAADLKIRAEEIKRALTARDQASEMLIAGTSRANVEITREEFERITRPLLEQALELTKSAVKEAEALGFTTLDRVLLVGGSSFMPAVAASLSEEFGWTPELEDPNQAVAKGAALAGQRAELRARISEKLEEQGKDMDSASDAEIEDVVSDLAPELGMDANTALGIATTGITNVCSRGFGVKLVKEGADPEGGNEAFTIEHLVTRNDPLPLDPPRTMEVFTIVPNQQKVHLEVMEQGGADLSNRVEDNSLIVDGFIGLPGNDPQGTPMDLQFEMGEDGTLVVTLTHPGVAEPLRVTKQTGAIMSDAEIAQAKSQVEALSRQ